MAIALQFVGEWNRLRRDLLLRDYPLVARDTVLQNGALPEIHAEPIYKSTGIYRKYPKNREPASDRFYWRQHHKWLEQALGIIGKYRIGFYTGFIYYRDRNFNTLPPVPKAELSISFRRYFQEFATLYTEYLEFYNARQLSQLSNDPYFMHLAMALTVVNVYLVTYGLYDEMICDVLGKYGHWFENSEVLGKLKRSGLCQNLAVPRFLKSQTSEFLQAADLVTYVAEQRYHAEEKGVPNADETMNRWREYVRDLRMHDTPELQETRERETGLAVMLEVAAETCILDLRLRSEFKSFYRWMIAQIMASMLINEAVERLQQDLKHPTL